MLISKNGVKHSEYIISPSLIKYCDGEIIIEYENHILQTNDTIIFQRISNGFNYKMEFPITKINDNSFKIKYDINNYYLFPISCDTESVITKYGESQKSYFRLFFSDDNKHICAKNREKLGNVIFYDINYQYDNEVFETCLKKYDIIYNNIVYYRSDKNDKFGNKILPGIQENICNHTIWSIKNQTIINNIGKNFIPFSPINYDDRNIMMIEITDDNRNIISDIINNFKEYIFKCIDCRFFDIGEKNEVVDDEDITDLLNDDVKIYSNRDFLHIETKIDLDSSPNMNHEYLLKDFINDEKSKHVGKIIDYEKQIFEPVFYDGSVNEPIEELDILDDSKFKLVDSIRFNLFLREREYDEETDNWFLVKDKNGHDDGYWYSYKCKSGCNSGNCKSENLDKGDLLGDIGFHDSDVIGQTKRLNKSFIRLMFFDSPDRLTQTLQFYSTMFIDTPKQYSKYLKNKVNNVELVDCDEYVSNLNSDDNYALCLNFTCYNKYKMNGSSEGFYLYLYPDLVDGIKLTPLYMRVEFNHSKYGKTIPLTRPVVVNNPQNPEENYKPIEFGKNGFPETYTKKKIVGGKEYLYTDTVNLYNDMYTKIYIKYDEKNKRYVWFLPRKDNTSQIVLNLVEPRIKES